MPSARSADASSACALYLPGAVQNRLKRDGLPSRYPRLAAFQLSRVVLLVVAVAARPAGTVGTTVGLLDPAAWIWMALCRKTRQVVAYAIGNRSERTCRRLWEAIPAAYREGHCFTDFWAADQAVIPEEQHTAVGKETGETAHVERWNNTLRQRLARFVRKTLSFSKSPVMHEACLNLFLHRYNRERAIILM